MKSNVKLLIVAAAILAVLAGATAILMLTGSEDSQEEAEETTASSEVLSRLIYDKNPDKIGNIHIKNSTGEFDIKKYADKAWFIPEFVTLPHNTSALTDILNCAASVTSQQVAAENSDDMSVYGLSEPRAEVTITFDDDDKILYIGSDSPSPGLTYMRFKDENTVHAVNTSDIDCFLNDKFSFIAKTVYTAKQPESEDDTTDYSKINSITISRQDIDYDIVLEYDVRQDYDEIISGNSSSHVMTSPVRLDLNPDLAYNVLNNVFDLTASQIAVTSPSEETMADFGLTDPFAEINFDIVGGDLRFLIGNKFIDENGKHTGYYCYADGIDIIYIFDKSSVPWADVMPLDISMTMITSTYIYAVESIDVDTGDKNVHFDLNKDSENFAVSCKDHEIDPDNFKSYYQFILRAPAEELYIEEIDAPADIKLTIKNSYGTDVLEFIKSEDRMSVIRLNGVTSFRCRTAYTMRLIENLDRLLDGEKIIDTW